LNKGNFLGYTYPENQEYEFRCPIDGTDFQTLIMPPTYLKTIQHPIISQLISESAREIRATKKIVFIGYSLSSSDVHIKALFKKQMNEEKEIIVINSKQKESLELNYKSLTKKVRFIYHSFEDFVNNEELFNSIF
jgi:ABC-type polar amino acid transport system ATPase subunit